MERVKFNTRVNASDKERWHRLVQVYEGTAYEMFGVAMDQLETIQKGGLAPLPPMQRAQAAIVSLGNALGELAAEIEKTEALRQRIEGLEIYIKSSERKQAEREAELLGDTHRLREELNELKGVHKELEQLRGKYDAVMRDRTDLKRKLKKFEER